MQQDERRDLSRRHLLKNSLSGLVAAVAAPRLMACTSDGELATATGAAAGSLPLRSRIADLGPLGAPDSNGIRLPPGFTSQALAQSGDRVAGTNHRWHSNPDGGATFSVPGPDQGWVYVSNAESYFGGGVGALRFDPAGNVVDAYSILRRTRVNCAGGATPWNTWLSCEERSRGRVYETDPFGVRSAVVRPALGVFKHEAVAVDPVTGYLYLTEDERDGRLYRFRSTAPGPMPDLASGTLEVAKVDASNRVTWLSVADPQYTGSTPTRYQRSESTAFNGGEGIWYANRAVVFSTKGDDRVRRYDVDSATMSILYDAADYASPPLRGVDNVTVTCCGDVLVAEDGGSMQIVAILPDGRTKPVLQITGQDRSEVTGPAFDPSGTRLYFSSQRGKGQGGITYVATGPFHA